MELTEQLKSQIEDWNESLKDKSAIGVISYFLQHFGEKILLSTSLGLEDQALIWELACQFAKPLSSHMGAKSGTAQIRLVGRFSIFHCQ